MQRQTRENYHSVLTIFTQVKNLRETKRKEKKDIKRQKESKKGAERDENTKKILLVRYTER